MLTVKVNELISSLQQTVIKVPHTVLYKLYILILNEKYKMTF